jgi:hypothetical protein
MRRLKISALLFLLVGSLPLKVFSQQESNKPKKSKAYYSVFAGAGRSVFQSSIEGPTKFPTPEFRLGGSVGIPLNKHFELISRLDFGIKVKRESPNQPRQFVQFAGLFMDQEEMTSRNHYFFEIPLMIQYRLAKPKLNLGAGLNYRSFFYVNSPDDRLRFDPLSGKKEFGAIGRISYRVNTKITLGLEQYFAINVLYGVAGVYDTEEYEMTVRNRFTQFTVEYRLSK